MNRRCNSIKKIISHEKQINKKIRRIAMKKRTLSVVLGICLLAAAMVSGCEKKGVEQSPKSDSSKQESMS